MDFYLMEMWSIQSQSNSSKSTGSLFLVSGGRIGRLFQWSNPFQTLNYHGRRQPALLALWTLLFIGYLPTAMQTEQQPQSGADCASCGRDKYLAVLKEEEVRQLRIESTKQQILDRLEMEDRPPRVKTKDMLLSSSSQMLLPGLTSDSSPNTEFNSSPLAHQIILFPVKIFRERNNNSNYDRLERLKFHITEEMFEAVLKSAVLWTAKINYTSSEAIWESTAVTESVDKQIDLERRHRYISLPVSTPRPSFDSQHQPLIPKPYLIVQLDPSTRRTNRVRRKKRSAASSITPMCGPNVTQCCRESLYVSFRDVGWDDWILAPLGFHAFYCRGSCRTFTAPASSVNTHTSVLQKLLARDRVSTETRPHLAPCCAPTRLSPLTIFYTDESDVIRQRSLPNMVVESCGCAL